MADHANVFYCADLGGYLLCYDSDLENLAAPNKSRMPKGTRLKPFQLLSYDSGSIDKAWVLRVVYRPLESNYGRRVDNFVDIYAVVHKSWLDRMAWQYDAAFPSGLPMKLITKSTNVEILY